MRYSLWLGALGFVCINVYAVEEDFVNRLRFQNIHLRGVLLTVQEELLAARQDAAHQLRKRVEALEKCHELKDKVLSLMEENKRLKESQ